MGYERKRGKLADLNSLLRSGAKNAPAFGTPSYLKRGKGELISPPFSLIVGETGVLSNVKYVITLDTDTQLPRDSARQFVGAMAHPLNRARYDEGKLWELKIRTHGNQHRIFYVVLQGNEMFLLHAYLKKTPKAPVNEIMIAKQRMKQLMEGKR